MAGPAFAHHSNGAGGLAMKQGHEGIVLGGTMLVIALALIAIVKWLFS
jgi:hypothetical protein